MVPSPAVTRLKRIYLKHVPPLLRKLPGNSRRFGPARKIHSSLPRWIAGRSTGGTRLISLEPARRVRVSRARQAIPRPPAFAASDRTYDCGPLHVGAMEEGRIATRDLDVISSDDGVFRDLYYQVPDGVPNARSLIIPRLPPFEKRPGRFATIATSRASNYYHWLNDCLPRLWALERAGIGRFRLLLPERLEHFHTSSLQALGFAEADLVPFGERHWQVDELLVPSLTSPAGWSHPGALAWLRDRILAPIYPSRPRPFRRLFISRARASKRRLENEAELFELLGPQGFELVISEALPFEQQVRLFHEAQVVVGAHGAGLANCLFMQPQQMVVELLPWHRDKPCFFSIARACSLDWGCVTDEPIAGVEAERPVGETDFSIPPERLAAVLPAIGETR